MNMFVVVFGECVWWFVVCVRGSLLFVCVWWFVVCVCGGLLFLVSVCAGLFFVWVCVVVCCLCEWWGLCILFGLLSWVVFVYVPLIHFNCFLICACVCVCLLWWELKRTATSDKVYNLLNCYTAESLYSSTVDIYQILSQCKYNIYKQYTWYRKAGNI